MLKRVAFIRRPDGMTREEFRDRWRNGHGPIALRIPGLRGYRLNFVARWMTEDSQHWDGFAELWFDDEDSMLKGFAALDDEIQTDRARFIGSVSLAIVDEHVLMPEPAQGAGA